MENFKLQTLRTPKVEYKDFILNDTRRIEQMTILLNLQEMTDLHLKRGIIDSTFPEPNTQLSTKYTVGWAFEVYKMKKAILHKSQYKINLRVAPVLTPQANNVFLLAMIYSRAEIVQFFLQAKLININQSIFGSQYWPSYFLLACTCTNEVLNLFLSYKIKYSIGWNGLTPYLIAAYKSHNLPKSCYLDFITYKHYELFHRYRGVRLKDSFEQLPIFALDFACMNKDRALIKDILEAVPEAGSLSRLSFIVQNEENLFLILSRYDFRGNQAFNGETPLHYSCYSGDLCALSLLLNLGFPILQNYDSKWPHEVGSLKTREKATVFFNLCASDVSQNSKIVKKIFNQRNFEEKMVQWMEVLRFNPKDYEKYCGIFRYIKFNRSHKILTNSRFNIVNLLTMAKTPVEVEQYIKKMLQFPFYEKTYPSKETQKLFDQFYK